MSEHPVKEHIFCHVISIYIRDTISHLRSITVCMCFSATLEFKLSISKSITYYVKTRNGKKSDADWSCNAELFWIHREKHRPTLAGSPCTVKSISVRGAWIMFSLRHERLCQVILDPDGPIGVKLCTYVFYEPHGSFTFWPI